MVEVIEINSSPELDRPGRAQDFGDILLLHEANSERFFAVTVMKKNVLRNAVLMGD